MPATDGLYLLSADDFELNRWTAERLPVTRPVGSVTLIDTTIDGRSSTLVAYRVGDIVYATFTMNGQWHHPEAIRCVG